MRTYGRTYDVNGNPTWVQVSTDASGNNDMVWLTTLVQTLKLGFGESPFYATSGIPAEQSVMQQVFPDYYVTLTQQTFAQYFASLVISKVANGVTPTYSVKVTTNQGVTVNASVPIPT